MMGTPDTKTAESTPSRKCKDSLVVAIGLEIPVAKGYPIQPSEGLSIAKGWGKDCATKG